MRVAWMPLVVARLDLHVKGETTPLAHQCILPYTNKINLRYGGGFGKYPFLAAYESLVREGISASSPYYRFLCAYRLYDGINPLRQKIRQIAKKISVITPLPRDPRIDMDMMRKMGIPEDSLIGIKTVNDLFGKLKENRNWIAHFLLNDGSQALNFSDGKYYQLIVPHESFRWQVKDRELVARARNRTACLV